MGIIHPSDPNTPVLDSPFPAFLFIALFSALLFASHPLQTQAVTYIVQRFASLATFFYLLSVVMYVMGRLKPFKAKDMASASEERVTANAFSPLGALYFFLSLVFAVCAMKTKEIAFTLPLVIVLCEFMFFKSFSKKNLLFLLPVLLTLIIVPLSVLQSDRPLGEILSDVSEKTRVQTGMSRWDYLMTEMRVIATYMRLILLPIKQNLDYDYPVYHTFFAPPVFLSFLLLLSVLGLGTYLLFRAHRAARTGQRARQKQRIETAPSAPCPLFFGYYRLITFGIFWFFITLSVESSVIPIADVIFEHRVYLPSVGLLLAMTTGLFVLASKLKIEKFAVLLLVLATIALSGMTYARNTVWKNDMSLWKDVVGKSPDKARPHNNLGLGYDLQGDLDQASTEYQTALRLYPDFAEAHNNLGTVFHRQGRIDLAIGEFETAVRLSPGYATAHSNLGVAYMDKGLRDRALAELNKALAIDPTNVQAIKSRGLFYVDSGQIGAGVSDFREACALGYGEGCMFLKYFLDRGYR